MSWAPGPGPLPTAQPVPWPAPATPAGTGVIQHAACPSSSRDGADGGAETRDAKTLLRYAPGWGEPCPGAEAAQAPRGHAFDQTRSEEHTSELQSQSNLVCRLLLE